MFCSTVLWRTSVRGGSGVPYNSSALSDDYVFVLKGDLTDLKTPPNAVFNAPPRLAERSPCQIK